MEPGWYMSPVSGLQRDIPTLAHWFNGSVWGRYKNWTTSLCGGVIRRFDDLRPEISKDIRCRRCSKRREDQE